MINPIFFLLYVYLTYYIIRYKLMYFILCLMIIFVPLSVYTTCMIIQNIIKDFECSHNHYK
jgi:hypothetical protein